MTARRSPNSAEFATWCEAEALVTGWLSVRPYAKPNNRAGAPDMLLARDGTILAVWVRPGSDGLVKAQAEWAKAITGGAAPTPAHPVEPGKFHDNVAAVLIHPTADGAALLRQHLS